MVPPSQIRRYIREFQPTVIHFVGDGWFWGHIWSWLWSRGRAKLVFTPSFHSLSWARQWLRVFNIPLCRMVHHVVALTELERNRVRKAYLVPEGKLSVIGWGVKPPVLSPERENGQVVQVLCVGRLGDHKGQMWLLDVYRRAKTMFQRPARLVLVGRDEGREAAIRLAVKDWGLEDEVVITGEVTDQELASWYAGSDVFALFSRYEAFGLVYFEAMSHGMPVLTHDIGANGELLTRGSVVVPPFHSKAAEAALVRLVNDGQWRRNMGAEGRDYALSEFSWPVVARRYLELYKSG